MVSIHIYVFYFIYFYIRHQYVMNATEYRRAIHVQFK